jgi:hypothetical protein
MNETSKIPKRWMPFLVAVLVIGVLLPAILLYQIRSRLDATTWLWGFFLISAIFAISVPVLRWQQKHKTRYPSFPWPVVANPYFGKALEQRNVSLEGTFTWTPGLFKRVARAFVRCTPAGRNHRRTIYAFSAIGAATTLFSAVLIYTHELGGFILLAVSALFIGFTYSLRARVPEEIRDGAQVRWNLSNDLLTMAPVATGTEALMMPREIHLSSSLAIVRTPAGFIIWPSNPVELFLPFEAFTSQEQIEFFHSIARSSVRNYVDCTSTK